MNSAKRPFVRLSRALFLCFTVLTFQVSSQAQTIKGGKSLDPKLYHLGDDVIDLWPGISHKPEGEQLNIRFNAKANSKEFTLSLTYWDVNHPAEVLINGKNMESLAPSQKTKDATVSIPAGTLVNGQNTLTIKPRLKDDCVIGKVFLHDQSFRELMKLKTVTLSVLDGGSKELMPARITITDKKGAFQKIYLAPTNGTAVRTGLIYISGKETEIDLVEGDYVFHATRGMEWSLDTKAVALRSDTKVELKLRREVDTKGFVATDTHIHTLTFSGHGDATAEERIITIAGEGVELAIATDHHHQTDYKPFQEKLGMNKHFTPVTGNEVSTKVGHFNTFPMVPNGPVPNKHETNWVKLVQDMRNHGGKVVILNHPRWRPQDVFNANALNTVTGERGSGALITFDAMELVNSAASIPNQTNSLKDWFALLNYGDNVSGLGASDSHNVGVPVGQARTYVRSSTDVPSKINVDEAVQMILKGDMSASFGIFADVLVNGRFKMGETVPVKDSTVKVKLRVASPSWVQPERAEIYLNGVLVAEKKLALTPGKPFNQFITFNIPSPKHDAYLVCAVFGNEVSNPTWKSKEPYTFAATNPLFLDTDRDGKYRSPRDTARNLLAAIGNQSVAQWKVINDADDAVAVQMVDLIHKASGPNERNALRKQLKASNRQVFQSLLETWPSPATETPLSAK